MNEKIRCPWAGTSGIMAEYHDQEWGKPVTDDRVLFEFLVLEGAQAGLSWLSILKRREGYRLAFHDFNPDLLASLDDSNLNSILLDPGIIRNRAKVFSVRSNAIAFLKVRNEYGTFFKYLYSFLPEGLPIVNYRPKGSLLPAISPEAVSLSKDMKKRGFLFFGPVICYAFMQATGMVNDHFENCFLSPSHPHSTT